MRETLPCTLYSAHKGASEEGRASSIQNFGQQNPQLAINKAILSHFVEDARQSGAFNFISQTKRTIIEEYLTTQQSLAELGTKPSREEEEVTEQFACTSSPACKPHSSTYPQNYKKHTVLQKIYIS
jgi:hypothetical protein